MAAPAPTRKLAATGAPEASRYSVLVTRDPAAVRAAQRLRYEVFATELGARLADPDEPGLDVDPLDAWCDHLIVRDNDAGVAVGTYRLLPPDRARQLRMSYSDTEFDLGSLAGIRGELVEVGRSCVDPAHRRGAVIGLMWAGIARYMLAGNHQWLGGCTSVPLDDGGALAHNAWRRVSTEHLAPAEYRVRPHRPWAPPGGLDGAAGRARLPLPPLLRGYLRLGAWVCGPPAYDSDFGVADFFVLLSIQKVDARHLAHLLGSTS